MEFTIQTSKKEECIDITSQLEDILQKSKIKNGLLNVYVPHATAAIITNENADPNICLDLLEALDKLIPQGIWRHDKLDGNAAPHIKASILGPSETIHIKDGKLQLGTWQNIFLVELDGPRERKILVKIIPEHI